jgi:hypothetical protein
MALQPGPFGPGFFVVRVTRIPARDLLATLYTTPDLVFEI